MRTNWELFTKADGDVGVQMSDGRLLSLSAEGDEGYDFILDYLRTMSHHYRHHLMAADLLLREHLGANTVDNIRRASPRRYHAQLAIQSMHCIFGVMDTIPDCDTSGNFNTEFVPCPCRATCRYNGFNPRNKDKDIVCCNPLYDTGLPPRQRTVADLLVNTSYSNSEIATALNLSVKTIENTSSMIYATLGVANRQELTLLLRNKRIV